MEWKEERGGERKGRSGRDSGTVEASREEETWLVARDRRRLLKASSLKRAHRCGVRLPQKRLFDESK